MKKSVWISYDLGIKGDYQSLYEWLDNHDAKECGYSLAFLIYDFQEDLFSEIKSDLEEHVNFENGDRVYIIYISPDNKIKGKFIRGKRKGSPWTGYATSGEEVTDSAD